MYIASLSDSTVNITTPDVIASITYPHYWMAVNAYIGIAECCNRFSKDPDLNPQGDILRLMQPKIYVYGEMHTWQQYLKRLLLTAEKIGAIIHLSSVSED